MFGSFSTSEFLLLLVLGLFIFAFHRLFGRSSKTKESGLNQQAKSRQSDQPTSDSQLSPASPRVGICVKNAPQNSSSGWYSSSNEKKQESSLQLRFDAIDPLAVAYARTHLPENILGPLKERGREIIQCEVTRAMSGQQTPQQVARLIRDNALALTPEQIIGADIYWKDLIKKGLDSSTINRRMERFNARQLQGRAEMIARHACLTATHQGQLQSIREEVAQGKLDPSRTNRKWIVAHDDQLCDICRAMDGKEVPADKPWTLEDGTTVWIPQEAHTQCRCSWGLVTNH